MSSYEQRINLSLNVRAVNQIYWSSILTLLVLFNGSDHWIILLLRYVQIFWYHLKRDCRKKQLYAVVAYIGPIKNATKYRYKWQLYSKTDANKVTFTKTTASDTCNANDLFSSGQAAILSYKVVKQFIDESKQLSWRLKILIA